MTAFLFIGQGVSLPWVGAELLADPVVASLVACASEHASTDIARLLVRGGRELERSEILQPAMVAVCLGVHALLGRAGVRPTIVLGHSLGELTAWAAAGGIAPEAAISVAALRGKLMAREAARRPGGMLRIIGDRATCEQALAVGASAGSICVGAHNGPTEWAVSGDEPALARIIGQFKATRLAVAGAWHSPAMAGAVDELTAALASLPRLPMRARMVTNHDGRFADDAELPALLAGQLVRPVQWATSIATVADSGVQRLLAVGPGKMLRSLVHRNLGVEREVEIIDSARAIAAAAARATS